jgi:hypothetical protein
VGDIRLGIGRMASVVVVSEEVALGGRVEDLVSLWEIGGEERGYQMVHQANQEVEGGGNPMIPEAVNVPKNCHI